MPSTPLIGAHLSTAGGLRHTVCRARAIGAMAIQVFPGNPRSYRPAARTLEEIREFAGQLQQGNIPLFVHSSYVLNLASPEDEIHRRSTEGLAAALRFGALAGAGGVVTHIGSHKGEGVRSGIERVAEAVSGAIDLTPEVHPRLLPGRPSDISEAIPPLLLEVAAGGGDSLGKSPSELGFLIAALPNRTAICLDTAHLFAAGFPIHTDEGAAALLTDLDRHVGMKSIRLVHLNDSRMAFGSKTDRHQNLGEGVMGLEGLRPLFLAPQLKRIPFILEVPGSNGNGPDAANIRIARAMAAGRL